MIRGKKAAPSGTSSGNDQARTDQSADQFRYKDLLQHLPVGVYRSTTSGRIIEANQALVGMLGGRSLADLQQLNVKDLYVRKKSRQEHMQRLAVTTIAFSEFEPGSTARASALSGLRRRRLIRKAFRQEG